MNLQGMSSIPATLLGRGFTSAESCAIEAAVPNLLTKSCRTQCELWGKILGHRADYIIVSVFDQDPLEAQYLASSDCGLSFFGLDVDSIATREAVKPLHQQSADAVKPVDPVLISDLCDRIQGPYLGDAAYEYRVKDPSSRTVFAVRESQRLAAFIVLHRSLCRIAPRGAYIKRNPKLVGGKSGLTRNPDFQGLSAAAVCCLDSFVHLRPATRPRTRLEMEHGAASGTLTVDFLDPISDDLPRGLWSLKFDAASNMVFGLHNRLQGAAFFHVPGTTETGNVYIGDGVSSTQRLPFMLP